MGSSSVPCHQGVPIPGMVPAGAGTAATGKEKCEFLDALKVCQIHTSRCSTLTAAA